MGKMIKAEGFDSTGFKLLVTYNQDDAIDAIRNNDIVFITGQAGTGKGYISIAEGLRCLRTKKGPGMHIKKILYLRPAVSASEDLGFLPGTLEEKTVVFMRPMIISAAKLIGPKQFNEYLKKGKIELQTLSFIRGETWDNMFVIVDEAQNCTAQQIKMILTRIGKHAKLVMIGDDDQSDIHNGGLADARKRLYEIDGIEFIEFTEDDNMRHPLVNKIHEAYKKNIC